jgi:hypothetical protein
MGAPAKFLCAGCRSRRWRNRDPPAPLVVSPQTRQVPAVAVLREAAVLEVFRSLEVELVRRKMADLMNTLMEAREGKLAVKLSRDFTKLVAGVVETNKKGEMLIKIMLAPNKTDDGSVQMFVTAETKLKVPEFGIGPSVFFVDENNELMRTDPRQAELFATEEVKR